MPTPTDFAHLEELPLAEVRREHDFGENELAQARLLVSELEADQIAIREYIARREAEGRLEPQLSKNI